MHSLGQVTIDKEEDSLYIDVFPIELHPGKSGELSKPDLIKHENYNIKGELENLVVSKTTTIKAKWLPLGNSNLLEPPMVGKGETVILYRYADTDNYFWVTLYNQQHLRKRDKYTIYLSNKGSVVGGDEDLEKAYYLTFDTINKYIRLHTDDTDGELTTYDIEINTKEGFLTIIDGKKNEITLDSDKDTLTINTNNEMTINTTNTVNVNTTACNVTCLAVANIVAPAINIVGGITNINP